MKILRNLFVMNKTSGKDLMCHNVVGRRIFMGKRVKAYIWMLIGLITCMVYVQVGNIPTVHAEAYEDFTYAESASGGIAITGYSGSDTVLVIPSMIDGKAVTSIDEYAFWECSSLKSVKIPGSVMYIGEGAFEDCSSLTSIEMPGSVTSIDECAFAGCSSLPSIEIPGSVMYIGADVFEGCNSLTSVKILDGVTSIRARMFEDCSNLTSVEIPESVTSIGDSAFEGCSSLTSIEIPASVTNIGSAAFYDTPWLRNKQNENPIVIVNHIVIDGKKCEGDVIIPDGVTAIGQTAFGNCSSLTSVEIPESVTSIWYGAFWGCSSLTSIVIPESVTSIRDEAFYGCSSLALVVSPDSYAETYAKENHIPYTYSGEKKDNPENPVTPSQESKITLNMKTLSFDTIGATQTLKATVTSNAADKTVTWISSDTKVATVTDGVVTSVGNGTAVITAKTADEKTATASVTVSQKTTKLSIQLNNQSVLGTLKARVKKSYSFKAVVTPDNADAKNAKVTWTSSNKKIATVTSKGKVTIKKAGKVTITAKTADGRKAAVKLNATKKAVKVTKLKITGSKTMKAKVKQTLKVKLVPATADNQKVKWKSSNTKVATVNSKGVVTAKKAGKVTITATAKDGSRKKATFKISVKK